jgi:hypothetical protein
MCPFCPESPSPCKLVERPDGKLACECGKHAWPNSAVFAEQLRQRNLTVVRAVHTWTQSF